MLIKQDEKLKVIKKSEWQTRSEKHEKAVSALVDEYLTNKSHQQKNPVVDFLFTYYNYKPSHLKRWSPGVNSVLRDAVGSPQFSHKDFITDGNDIILPAERFPTKRHNALLWTCTLLRRIDSRQPLFNCCGMHEWAMVYKAGEVRHEQFPLRMSDQEITEFVEAHPPACTHFDALRFFTKEARPLNRFNPERETIQDFEQPGCIHTNMDTYKWAYKMFPWVSSDLILKSFKLALEARKIDMMAGPYDLSSLGYEPIPVETESGRVRYKKEQAEIWKKTAPVRKELILNLRMILETLNLN